MVSELFDEFMALPVTDFSHKEVRNVFISFTICSLRKKKKRQCSFYRMLTQEAHFASENLSV